MSLMDPGETKSNIIKDTIKKHQDVQDAFEYLPEIVQVDLLFNVDMFKRFQFQHAQYWKYQKLKQILLTGERIDN